MADRKESGDGGSWWGSWIQTAKEKSASAMEFVKKDLAEFTTTMQRDTNTAVSVTSTTLKETFKPENTEAAKDKMKQSINGFFDGLSKALTVPGEDLEKDKTKTRDLGTAGAIYDRSKARLHAVQIDPGTYLNEPSGSPELFESWLETFNLDSKKGDISELLVVKVEVRALYTKLVPSELSHSEFWQRYFYKLHQLQQDEARKQALMKRAETPTEDDSLGWEDDWSGDECEEFEKVTDSEVKAIQREDVQERLSPVTDSKVSDNGGSTQVKQISAEDKSLTSKDVTNVSKSEKQNLMGNKADEKFSSKNTDKHKDSIPGQHADSSSGQVEECDSYEPKVEVCDASEIKTDSPSDNTETLLPVDDMIKSDIPVSPPEPISSETPSDPEATSKAPVPLTTKEADILALATQSSREDQPVPEADIHKDGSAKPLDTGASDTDVVKEGNSPGLPAVTDKDLKEVEKGGSSSVLAAVVDDKDIKTKVKGDLVVVGSDRESPTSESSGNKDYLRLVPEPSVDDDWEHDFDVELTEEDLKAAEEIAKKMGSNLDNQDDDWENWE